MDRQFPPEVVLLIVEASLGPYDSFDMLDDHIPRYSTLCNYSRLNSVCRNISKPMLYESVVVKSNHAEGNLLSLVEKEDSTEVEMIKALAIRRRNNPNGWSMRVTLALIDRLRDRVESLALDEVEFSLVRGGKNLRRLLLQRLVVNGGSAWTPTIAYPRLHYLHITLSRLSGDIPPPAHHFPQLRSFYSFYSGYSGQEAFVPTPEIFSRLTALYVDEGDRYEALIPHANQLKLLSVSCDDEIFPLLDKAPRFLHLNRQTLRDGMYALQYQVEEERAGLETIFWDYEYGHSGEWDVEDEEECEERVNEYADILAERGVKIVKGSIGFRDAVERMEAIVAKEKRAAADKERRARKW